MRQINFATDICSDGDYCFDPEEDDICWYLRIKGTMALCGVNEIDTFCWCTLFEHQVEIKDKKPVRHDECKRSDLGKSSESDYRYEQLTIYHILLEDFMKGWTEEDCHKRGVQNCMACREVDCADNLNK